MVQELKYCYKCKKEKHISDFYSNISKFDGLASECKSCSNEAGKIRASTVIYKHNYHYQCIKRNYGLEPTLYDNMLISQLGKCYICLKQADLEIDHNHKTGQIRKLLCQDCNLALGGFKDSQELLNRAAKYVIGEL